MRRAGVKDFLVAGLVLLVSRLPKPAPRPPEKRIVPEGEPSPRAELLAVALLLLAATCGAAFIFAYAYDRLPSQTQLMGLALGLGLVAFGAALIVVGKRLVVTEELQEDYPPEEHPDEQLAIAEIVDESGDRLTRRRLFKLSLIAAGGALGTAALVPLASLGPVLDLDRLADTPWGSGRRLVDEEGKPYAAAEIEQDSFYTAFPEGASREQLGAPLVVVRLPPGDLRLPPQNSGYDANGIVAYSKICTHAGCAISLYRAPLFDPAEPAPALVCPCHYSTFDPAEGGKVTFGPAGRKLPMLPLYVDRAGHLRAGGNFDGAVGPSWSGVRSEEPR